MPPGKNTQRLKTKFPSRIPHLTKPLKTGCRVKSWFGLHIKTYLILHIGMCKMLP